LPSQIPLNLHNPDGHKRPDDNGKNQKEEYFYPNH